MTRNEVDPLLREFFDLFRHWFGKSLDEAAMKQEMSDELWAAWEATRRRTASKAERDRVKIIDHLNDTDAT
jgi:hypothetical protein